MRILFRLLNLKILLVCWVGFQVSFASAEWPEIAVPSEMRSEWVAQDLNQNGVPMQIIQLSGQMSSENIEAFYRQAWQQHDVVVNELGPWKILGAKQGPYQFTAQLPLESGALRPLIAVAKVDQLYPHAADKLVVELPPGCHPVSDTRSDDGPTLSRVLVCAAKQSKMSIALFFEQSFKAKGWQKETALDGGQHANATSVLAVYQKQRDEIIIAFKSNPREGNTVVLTYVRKKSH